MITSPQQQPLRPWLIYAAGGLLASTLLLLALSLGLRRQERLLSHVSGERPQNAPGFGLHSLASLAHLLPGLPEQAQAQMRRRRPGALRQLDVEKTVIASVRRLGYPTPCYRARKQIPEYLLLVDSARPRSLACQWRKHWAHWLQNLHGANVYRYDYHGDPRRLYAPCASQRVPLNLRRIQQRHESCRLLLLGEASGWFRYDAASAQDLPADWLAASPLGAWRERLLFCGREPAYWGVAERRLAQLRFRADAHRPGLPVLPLNTAGLSAYGWLLAGKPLSLSSAWTPLYPSLLYDPDIRYAHPADFAAPHKARRPLPKVDRLMVQLQEYLGAYGFRWLAACAASPTLDLPKILLIGQTLFADAGFFQPDFIARQMLRWQNLP